MLLLRIGAPHRGTAAPTRGGFRDDTGTAALDPPYRHPYLYFESLALSQGPWRNCDFKLSDFTRAADLDYGSESYFNDLEDSINPLQNHDLL